MGTPHLSSHGSSVSLGAFGQHAQPEILKRHLHFFVFRPGDSSKEAQCGCKEGLTFQTGAWHPVPTSPWWYRCKIFILPSYSGLIFSSCSFCVSVTHLPNSAARFFAPGVLVKEFLSSPALLKLFSQPSPATLPHIVQFHFLPLDTASAFCSPLVFLATIRSLLPAWEGSFWILYSLLWYLARPEHPIGQTVPLPSASIQIESCS